MTAQKTESTPSAREDFETINFPDPSDKDPNDKDPSDKDEATETTPTPPTSDGMKKPIPPSYLIHTMIALWAISHLPRFVFATLVVTLISINRDHGEDTTTTPVPRLLNEIRRCLEKLTDGHARILERSDGGLLTKSRARIAKTVGRIRQRVGDGTGIAVGGSLSRTERCVAFGALFLLGPTIARTMLTGLGCVLLLELFV